MTSDPAPVPAYAIAYLREVDFGDDVIRYMRDIDATLKPFGGQFLIHGGRVDVREGDWGDGDLVVIAFPDNDAAVGWYESADYQRIATLRTNNSNSIAAIVEGVAPGHTGAKKADELLGLQVS
jgi:uncharacterized protein (DUF1330 family)